MHQIHDMHEQRLEHQTRIAACREYRHALLGWEKGYLASLDIWLRREPVLNSIQLGTLYEIHQRAIATAPVKESLCQA